VGQTPAAVLRARLEQARAELRLVGAGAALRDRLRIARVLGHAHLRLGRARIALAWLPAGDDPPREIRLRGGPTVLARRADAVPLYEQFALSVYGVELPFDEVRTILDLGANVGYATLALAALYPGASFVCVEPEPRNRAVLLENLRRNGLDARVLDFAIVGSPGSYRLVQRRAPSGTRVERGTDGDVEGVTISALLDRAGIEHVDLMKVDIEGAEHEVFLGASEWAPRVRALVGELHPPLHSSDADRLLAPHGFARVKLPPGERFKDVVFYVRD
jgi:FkbM family methyltransferase